MKLLGDSIELWDQVRAGDELFSGLMLKQSEFLGRWNSRYVTVIRIDEGVIALFYWVDESNFKHYKESPRGGFNLTNCSVDVSQLELTVSLRHVTDAYKQGDCFGSRVDLQENFKCSSIQQFSLFSAAVGAPVENTTSYSSVTPYGKEKTPRSSGEENRLKTEYTLLGELGRGAFSVVYRGAKKDTDTNSIVDSQQCAIKVVYLGKCNARERQKQLRYLNSEVAIMRKLSKALAHSKQVVHLIDSFSETKPEHMFCMILELCNGGELFDRIVKRNFFSESDAKLLFLKLSTALKDLHSIGIVHRDIKPENLIYDTPAEDAEIKLTDFGLSLDMAHKDDDVYRSHVVGTCGYFAPEVLTLHYGPACDVWSLGVVLYILLCGYPPFSGVTNADIQKKTRFGQFEFHKKYWKNISKEAKELISSMLVVRPKNRASIEQVLAHPWMTEVREADMVSIPLDSHKKFNNKRKLKAAAYAVIWSSRLTQKKKDKLSNITKRLKPEGFTPDDLSLIKQAFEKNAKESEQRDVLPGFTEFQNTMVELGYSKLPLERLFKLFDEDGDGVIDKRELLAGLAALQGPDSHSIKFCFDVYDLDGSGEIDKDELLGILSMAISNSQMDPEKISTELVEAFEQIDMNGDGVISYQEFKNACKIKPYLRQCFLSKRLSEISK